MQNLHCTQQRRERLCLFTMRIQFQKMKQYVLGMSNEPLVLHGTSGSGKTSIMAMATKEAWRWFKGKATIVLRYVMRRSIFICWFVVNKFYDIVNHISLHF